MKAIVLSDLYFAFAPSSCIAEIGEGTVTISTHVEV